MTGRPRPKQNPYRYSSNALTPNPGSELLQPFKTSSLGQPAKYEQFEEPSWSWAAPSGATGVEHKSFEATAPVKHRRTRKGCYTCRSRRVKVSLEIPAPLIDHTEPLLSVTKHIQSANVRCSKGGRDCVYPEFTTTARSGGSSATDLQAVGSRISRSDGSADEGLKFVTPSEETAPLSAFADWEQFQNAAARPTSTQSQAGLTNQRGPSSTIPELESATTPAAGSAEFGLRQGSQQLQLDLRFYIEYHKTHITQYHYSCKYDDNDFWHTTLLDLAMQHEPLLYAVVAFAAYHYAVRQPNGKLQDFLGYYDRSVSLIRQCLQLPQTDTVVTLMTILQLAEFEKCLGDWVSLLGHQKAAHRFLTQRYTAYSILQDATLRNILEWYMIFDLFTGLLSGSGTMLGREWFDAYHEYYVQQIRSNPNHLGWRFREITAEYRLICSDVANLFARENEEAISSQNFTAKAAFLSRQLDQLEEEMHPSLRNPAYVITTDWTEARPEHRKEHLDIDKTCRLYGGPLWTTNLIRLDIMGMQLMFGYHLANRERARELEKETATKVEVHPDLAQLALKVCQMFEAIENCPQSPPGSIVIAQASLGMAVICLAKDQERNLWCRRKLAVVEASGCIFPTALRTRMAEVFGEEVLHWWLPHDEAYPPIIQSIRGFTEERSQIPRNQDADDIEKLKGLFTDLDITGV